jgi:hypothetical protein
MQEGGYGTFAAKVNEFNAHRKKSLSAVFLVRQARG